MDALSTRYVTPLAGAMGEANKSKVEMRTNVFMFTQGLIVMVLRWLDQNFSVALPIKLAALALIWSPHASWLTQLAGMPEAP